MPTLPVATEFTGPGITEAQFKTAITNLRGFLADLLGTAGSQAAAQVALQALLGAGVDARSGAYTVVAGDRGKLINATGTWTLALTAAATLGAGFAFALRNSGAGVITIDPNASEQIDGATTISVAAGSSCLVVCTGAAWLTVGLAVPISYPISVANGGTGATSAAGARGNLAAVGMDHGYNTVGSFCFAGASIAKSTSLAAPGGTVAGSSLRAICQAGQSTAMYGSALSGTWRCLGFATNPFFDSFSTVATLWQRIS